MKTPSTKCLSLFQDPIRLITVEALCCRDERRIHSPRSTDRIPLLLDNLGWLCQKEKGLLSGSESGGNNHLGRNGDARIHIITLVIVLVFKVWTFLHSAILIAN